MWKFPLIYCTNHNWAQEISLLVLDLIWGTELVVNGIQMGKLSLVISYYQKLQGKFYSKMTGAKGNLATIYSESLGIMVSIWLLVMRFYNILQRSLTRNLA